MHDQELLKCRNQRNTYLYAPAPGRTGQQKGFCHTKTGVDVMQKFMEEIEERGTGGEVFLTNTGCFGICEKGPIVVVYPDNVWYGSVTPGRCCRDPRLAYRRREAGRTAAALSNGREPCASRR